MDRIDSARHYTSDNICVISHRANTIKHNGTPDEIFRVAVYAELAKRLAHLDPRARQKGVTLLMDSFFRPGVTLASVLGLDDAA